MLNYFNLIITTYRRRENIARTQMSSFLYGIGDSEAKIQISNISGILVCLTELDAFSVVEKAKTKLLSSKDLWKFDHILRIIPIEEVVNTELNEIIVAATNIASRKIYEKEEEEQQRQQEPSTLPRLIPPLQQEKKKTEERQQEEEQLSSVDYIADSKASFRVTVEKRHCTAIRSYEIISAIAEHFPDRKVDLVNPNWIILVEVLGKLTGISVIRPNQIFSFAIEKRKLIL